MAKPKAMPDKSAVRAALVSELKRALATMARAAEQSRQGAVHEDSRSEGDKDMRSTEQSYLARGQAIRTEDLAEQVQRLEGLELRVFNPVQTIEAGALVRASLDDEARVLFVVPQGGGTVLEVDGTRVTVVTPLSPIGRALVGRSAGDSFELRMRGALREWSIEEVR